MAFNQVGVDVDAPIVLKQTEAVLPPEHVGHGLAKIGLARDPGGLCLQLGEEHVHQRAGQFMSDRTTVIGRWPADDGHRNRCRHPNRC
jgi:hypothetical protein